MWPVTKCPPTLPSKRRLRSRLTRLPGRNAGEIGQPARFLQHVEVHRQPAAICTAVRQQPLTAMLSPTATSAPAGPAVDDKLPCLCAGLKGHDLAGVSTMPVNMAGLVRPSGPSRRGNSGGLSFWRCNEQPVRRSFRRRRKLAAPKTKGDGFLLVARRDVGWRVCRPMNKESLFSGCGAAGRAAGLDMSWRRDALVAHIHRRPDEGAASP